PPSNNLGGLSCVIAVNVLPLSGFATQCRCFPFAVAKLQPISAVCKCFCDFGRVILVFTSQVIDLELNQQMLKFM
ncbi:MAG: hypothetical protein NC453_29255, partial [Muribaculum sp.]|nr:hypothetical protein [Muribaculum sp.]